MKTVIYITSMLSFFGLVYFFVGRDAEPEFGLDCVQFSNGIMVGAPPEYRIGTSRKDGINYFEAMRFSVEYPSFKAKNYPPKKEIEENPNIPLLELLGLAVIRTAPGYIEKSIGPDAKGHYTGFNIPDGGIFGLERWRLPSSNDFRNHELYKYISKTGYIDSVIIECDQHPIFDGARASCLMVNEYPNGTRTEARFVKSWLKDWREISENLELFLDNKIINEWGEQYKVLVQR